MKEHVFVGFNQEGDPMPYPVDTLEEIEAAQAAMRDAGVDEVETYFGEPDGLGDSFPSGRKLRAD